MGMVVLIDSPDFRVTASSRLLKARDAAVVADAADLMVRAHLRDKALRDQTLAALAQSRQQGFEQGMTEARQAMASRLATALAARQLALQDMVPTLVDIVVDAVSLLVKDAPRRAGLGAALETVGGLLRQARWARLRVHPSQFDEAHAALAEARGSLAAIDIVSVVGDPALEADDCIFETDVGIADASLSVQLAAIRSAVGASLAAIAEGAPALASDPALASPDAPTDTALGTAAATATETAAAVDE